jgi:hypothetical protein
MRHRAAATVGLLAAFSATALFACGKGRLSDGPHEDALAVRLGAGVRRTR